MRNRSRPSRRLVLGSIVGAAFAGVARAQTETMAALYEKAKPEGSVTWYTSHYPAETAERIRRAFLEQYPDIKLNLLRAVSGVVFQRVSQELKANALQCDLLGVSDMGNVIAFKEQGLFERYTPTNAETMLDLFRNLDPDGYFHATSCGVMAITHNTQRVAPNEIPANWPDLLDPRWKGKLSLAHPAFSGYVANWAMIMLRLYGRGYFERIRGNEPQISRSVQDNVTLLNSGERLVAAGNIASTLESAARGNPIAVVYPADGVVLVDSPSAILKGTKHPNAARLLMEFLASPRVSEIMVAEFGETMHKSVPPNPRARSLADVKVHRLTPAEIVAGMDNIKTFWRELFGV